VLLGFFKWLAAEEERIGHGWQDLVQRVGRP
jgi:hypothetical protein